MHKNVRCVVGRDDWWHLKFVGTSSRDYFIFFSNSTNLIGTVNRLMGHTRTHVLATPFRGWKVNPLRPHTYCVSYFFSFIFPCVSFLFSNSENSCLVSFNILFRLALPSLVRRSSCVHVDVSLSYASMEESCMSTCLLSSMVTSHVSKARYLFRTSGPSRPAHDGGVGTPCRHEK